MGARRRPAVHGRRPQGEQITAREDVRLLGVSRPDSGWLVGPWPARGRPLRRRAAGRTHAGDDLGRPLRHPGAARRPTVVRQTARSGCTTGVAGRRADVRRRVPAPAHLECFAAQLNEWVAQTASGRDEPAPDPLVMRRFRPSVVVDGRRRFAEDGWRSCGSERSRPRRQACDRCVMTTINPYTSPKARSPSVRWPGIAGGTARSGSGSTSSPTALAHSA